LKVDNETYQTKDFGKVTDKRCTAQRSSLREMTADNETT